MAERGRWGGERGREREGEIEREKEKDEGSGERGSTVTFLIRALIPCEGRILMISSKSDYLPKAPTSK